MTLVEVISDGFADVHAHGGRTVLQTLGVVLGVASVVATMGMMAGERAQVTRYWSETGGVLKVIVYPQQAPEVRSTARQQASRGLTVDDAEAIRKQVAGFDLVEPSLARRLLVRSIGATRIYNVTGVAPGFADLHQLQIGAGRFITDSDITSAESVCVLGADRARELFGTGSPLGSSLRIGGHSYRVVGVLRYREFYWNSSETWNALGWMNELILVPITAMQAREVGAGTRQVASIGLRLASVEDHATAAPALERLLLARHGVKDFRVFDRRQRMEQMDQENKVYDFTFTACGVISLLVGGIVVANILMASFTERMREVGVRKALGAKGWHIALLFLVESAIVTGLGGVAGLLLGVGFVHAIARLLGHAAVLTPTMIVAALASAGAVGLFFGFFPALKAARLDPVVALRYE